MAKQPWGTITHPKERNANSLMGHQELSGKEIDEIVERLYTPEWHNRHEKRAARINRKTAVEPEMSADDISNTVDRLTRGAEKRATDSNRTGSMREQGVCNTFQWKGW